MPNAEAMVTAIVDDLFTNGAGHRAERLVLTSAEGRNLGGWCEAAVRARVLAILNAPTCIHPDGHHGRCTQLPGESKHR